MFHLKFQLLLRPVLPFDDDETNAHVIKRERRHKIHTRTEA